MTGHRTFLVQFRQSHQRQCVDTIATHVQGDSRRRSGVLHPPRANQTSLLLPPIPLPSFSPPSLPLPDPSTSPPSYFPYLPLHSLPLSPNSTWLDSTRLDTFDFVEPVEPVEFVVSSESSCAVRLARHSQMHGLDTSNVSSRVKSSQVEFGL